MAMITCKDAAFAYEGRTVVEKLNFEVERGDYLCVVGENGSGKSTLIKGILNLIKLKTGSIIFDEGLSPKEMGYLPQQSIVQNDFPASVFEVVLSGRLGQRGILPFYTKNDKNVALENINKLNIIDIKNKCFRELSGGQKQRVLLARSLCSTSKILVLDEPISGLDPLATQELYEIIKEINNNFEITVIMVSHDIASAVKYANKILHLNNQQLFFGTTKEYLNSNVGCTFIGGEDTNEYNN